MYWKALMGEGAENTRRQLPVSAPGNPAQGRRRASGRAGGGMVSAAAPATVGSGRGT